MTGRRWHGVVALVDTDTTDDRRVLSGALDLHGVSRDHPTRVMTIPWLSGDGRPVGVIDRIEVVGTEVRAEGEVDLPPGRYGCGVDLAEAETYQSPDGVTVFVYAVLVGLTVYRELAITPAWPDCHIVVEEDTP